MRPTDCLARSSLGDSLARLGGFQPRHELIEVRPTIMQVIPMYSMLDEAKRCG